MKGCDEGTCRSRWGLACEDGIPFLTSALLLNHLNREERSLLLGFDDIGNAADYLQLDSIKVP